MLVTSSVTDMRLKAWMAASCTDSVVAGCLMHFISVVLIAASAASIASPMLPTTWMKESEQLEKKMELEDVIKNQNFVRGLFSQRLPTLKVMKVRSFSPAQSAPRREFMKSETAVISGVTPSAWYSLMTNLDISGVQQKLQLTQ